MTSSNFGYPPFSRLFIIGDRKATREDYKETFSKISEPAGITLIKDRNGENKGIVYIQMNKTSDACKAVEMFNGTRVGDSTRPMRVLIATNKSETVSDEDIMAQVSRLFVVVPKSYTEEDISEVFEKYGAVKKVVIIKDKHTNESKGLAFVTFVKSSDAATAYEECGSEFKPKFADPVSRKRQHEDGGDRHGDRHSDRMSTDNRMSGAMMFPTSNNSSRDQGPTEFLGSYPHNNQFYLKVRVPKGLNQHQLTRLFNVVPTLEFCRLTTNPYNATDTAIIGYSSASCCSYAKEVFHGFEYPPGCPLELEYYTEANRSDGSGPMNMLGSMATNMSMSHNASSVMSNIIGGSMMNNMSGMQTNTADMSGNMGSGNFAGGQTTSSATYTASDGEMKKRLFIVSHPERISTQLLADMFSKFGNFISVDYIPGKNYGFAKFASGESADKAQKYMHGETIAGNHLKCLEAEDPPTEHKKSKK